MYRVFQLISRLRTPLGCTKAEVAEDFDTTVRTVERHINLIRDLGFTIEKNGKRFRIPKTDTNGFRHEDMIVFSLEEAVAIRDALDSGRIESPLKESLLDKLYALTELDELAETLRTNVISSNIAHIRNAIKGKEQLLLRNYHSVNSNKVTNRLVEPLRFFQYYRYFLAFDTGRMEVRQFKTDRIGEASPTGEPWKFRHLHNMQQIDVFGLAGTQSVTVILELNSRAKLLLEEEFPDARQFIRSVDDYWIFEGPVYSFEGVGRFVAGLADNIKVISPEPFRQFLRDKLKRATEWIDIC